MGKRKGRSGGEAKGPAKAKAARDAKKVDVVPLPPPVAAQKVASAMLKAADRDDAAAAAAADVDESGGASAAAVVGVGVDSRTGEVRATPYRNKQRVLVLASRGITARHRHLLEDLRTLLPHHKKDSKLDTKGDVRSLNEICEVKSCNGALYLEARKRRDLYLWLSRAPHGPSGKFLVTNVHTMDELRLTGNCARGTRPLLAFCGGLAGPAAPPHWRLVRALLAATFGTPLGHPKSKPFFDHVLSFALVDGRVWVRHYRYVVLVCVDSSVGVCCFQCGLCHIQGVVQRHRE